MCTNVDNTRHEKYTPSGDIIIFHIIVQLEEISQH